MGAIRDSNVPAETAVASDPSSHEATTNTDSPSNPHNTTDPHFDPTSTDSVTPTANPVLKDPDFVVEVEPPTPQQPHGVASKFSFESDYSPPQGAGLPRTYVSATNSPNATILDHVQRISGLLDWKPKVNSRVREREQHLHMLNVEAMPSDSAGMTPERTGRSLLTLANYAKKESIHTFGRFERLALYRLLQLQHDLVLLDEKLDYELDTWGGWTDYGWHEKLEQYRKYCPL